MIRNIRIEVQKILHLPYLLLGVTGIIILCLNATGDMDAGGRQISIFSLMIRPENTGSQHVALQLWKAGIGGWLIVFAPMLLTVGYIISLFGERKNGQIRFALMRSGKLRYCISKVCGGALAGGMPGSNSHGRFGSGSETFGKKIQFGNAAETGTGAGNHGKSVRVDPGRADERTG